MRGDSILICVLLTVVSLARGQTAKTEELVHGGRVFPLYPDVLDEKPGMPSPFIGVDGAEYAVGLTEDGNFTIIKVTVENGETLNYKENLWYGKGRQLDVDSTDFPTLPATGLHSESELDSTRTITDRSVEEITRIARPQQYSRIGFLAQDEDIISVLKGDNRLVKRLGLTHPELAKPLFHVFNVILAGRIDSERGNIKAILYNDREVRLRFRGSKGWQESIFDDEILGYWEIEMWRELDKYELALLSRQYPGLSEEARSQMIGRLTYIHTGEMVPFYIMRYGFYEGHTGYRADPIAVAAVFGLRTMEEICAAFEGQLDYSLSRHYTPALSDNR